MYGSPPFEESSGKYKWNIRIVHSTIEREKLD